MGSPKSLKQIVWVDRAYNPTDLRANIPVPRHKPIVSSDVGKASTVELLPHIQKNHGCIVSSPYPSTAATRSEDSNTLTHIYQRLEFLTKIDHRIGELLKAFHPNCIILK